MVRRRQSTLQLVCIRGLYSSTERCVLNTTLQVTVSVHRLYWIWLKTGSSSQVTCPLPLLTFHTRRVHVLVGAVAHPAFLEESHFEKANSAFHASHPLLHHVWAYIYYYRYEDPSSYLARVSIARDHVEGSSRRDHCLIIAIRQRKM